MKIFLVILVEILLALIFMLSISKNYDGIIEFMCPFNNTLYSVSYSFFAATVYFIGGLTTILIYAVFNFTESRTINAYKKAHEKSEISHAEKDNKIQSLENKVKTLEIALENVLKNNNAEQDEES